MLVLLVEADPALGKFLGDRLREQKFSVDWMSDLQTAGAVVSTVNYAAAVLDLKSPREECAAVIAKLREHNAQLPIVIIGSGSCPTEKVLALDEGADDYLVRPIDPRELGARLRALIRRVEIRPNEPIIVGRIELDPMLRIAVREGKNVPLTRSEYQLLCALMVEPGRLVSRAKLEQMLYGLDEPVTSNSVEVHIYNLRRKLGEAFIKNVRGRGYRVLPGDSG
jgi:DNA-binding response OmpR family regulator